MVCISKQNHTFAVAGRAEAVAIHFLASDQQDLAKLFGTEAGDDVDKFARCRWQEGLRGTTILDESARAGSGPGRPGRLLTAPVSETAHTNGSGRCGYRPDG